MAPCPSTLASHFWRQKGDPALERKCLMDHTSFCLRRLLSLIPEDSSSQVTLEFIFNYLFK